MMDRRLLAKLSQCAWKVLNLYLTQAVPYDDAKVGAAVAVQEFWPPARRPGPTARRVIFKILIRIYMLWPPPAAFMATVLSRLVPTPQAKDLEEPFRYEVFKMLKAEGKINDVVIENMMNWPPARRSYASESVTVG